MTDQQSQAKEKEETVPTAAYHKSLYADIIWTDSKSSNAVDYQTGYLPLPPPLNEHGYVPYSWSPNIVRTQRFCEEINWPLSCPFIYLSTGNRCLIGILQYALYKSTVKCDFEYTLEFVTDFEDYVYRFTDTDGDGGDTYRLETKEKGRYFVSFNSKSRGIQYIDGEPKRGDAAGVVLGPGETK